MIRLGLIGYGAWGQKYPSAAMESGGFVTHIAGNGFTPYGSCSHYSSREWRKLLDAPVDAFIVATPPDTHEEIVTTLLEAGRPVMVEKPFALSAASAHRMAGVASKARVPLLINHQHLFAPAYETLRGIVKGGSWSIRSAGGNEGPRRSYSALWDYGSHDVAMQLGLANDMAEAHCVEASALSSYYASLHLSDCMDGFVNVWNNHPPKTRLLIAENDEHHLTYDALSSTPLVMDGLPIDVDSERPLQRAIRHFAAAITFGRVDWRFGGEIGVHVTEILERADWMIAANAAS